MRLGKLMFAGLVIVLFSGCYTVYTGKPEPGKESLEATHSLPGNISFYVIDHGVSWKIIEKRMEVIDNEEDWRKLWLEHVGAGVGLSYPPPPAKDLPIADFDKEMIVAVFGGPESGRAGLTITSIQREMLFIRVNILYDHRRRQPVDPMPYYIVKMEKTNIPIVFEESSCR